MKINLTIEDFADFTITFLLDKMLNPNTVVTDNDDFNELIDDMTSRGMKSILLRYYLNLSAISKTNYKRSKKTFQKKDDLILNVFGKDSVKKGKKDKDGFVKKTISKIVKKISGKNEMKIETQKQLVEEIAIKLKEIL